MTKKLLVLTLALALALPLLGLAAEAVTTAPEATTTPAAPWGGQRGRWAQQAPQTRFEDADQDGVCDNCGQTQGQNPEAPGFTDEDKDGVCDYYGTARQGWAGRQGMMGRMQGRMQGMRGRMQGRMGRAQGPNYADENNDGVCDHLGEGPQGFGPGSFGPGYRNAQPGQMGPGLRNQRPGRGPGRR